MPRARYIPQYSQDVLETFGTTFDQDVAGCIKSLGNEKVLLKNFFFERVLLLAHPKLDGNEELKFKFMTLLLDFLHMVGYIDQSPSLVDYVIDPVTPADELLDLMLGTRLPVFKSTDLGGEYASIDTLMVFFSDVLRRNALILNERKFMASRFRQWLGHIGFKLMTTSSESLSQAERSFLIVYGCTKKRTKGYIACLPSTPIPPVENKDPLVVEVGALATASLLSGPCTNHMKLMSNAILEQLILYYGPHVSDLKSSVGFIRKYGPYQVFDTTPEDSIPWLLESQLTGVSAMAGNIAVKPTKQPPFTLRTPLPIMFKNESGMISAYPDIPEFHLFLTDQKDISRFSWDYLSKWRGRRINSINDGGTMDYALCDLAVQIKTAGGMQVEQTELAGSGLIWLTDDASKKVVDYSGHINENYLLPSDKGMALETVDMAAYYARFGTIELLPAFSEFLELPIGWFLQPAERVVDFISSVKGLTLQERVRFSTVIALCHNCARYERLTKKNAPIDKVRYTKALLNLK